MTDNRRKAALLGAFAAMIPGIALGLGRIGADGGTGLFGLPRHFWSGFGIGLSLVLIAGSLVAMRKSTGRWP